MRNKNELEKINFTSCILKSLNVIPEDFVIFLKLKVSM